MSDLATFNRHAKMYEGQPVDTYAVIQVGEFQAASSRIADLEAQLENATAIMDSYARENQSLHDRAVAGIAKGRADALKEAAALCRSIDPPLGDGYDTCAFLAAEIEALAQKPQRSDEELPSDDELRAQSARILDGYERTGGGPNLLAQKPHPTEAEIDEMLTCDLSADPKVAAALDEVRKVQERHNAAAERSCGNCKRGEIHDTSGFAMDICPYFEKEACGNEKTGFPNWQPKEGA